MLDNHIRLLLANDIMRFMTTDHFLPYHDKLWLAITMYMCAYNVNGFAKMCIVHASTLSTLVTHKIC